MQRKLSLFIFLLLFSSMAMGVYGDNARTQIIFTTNIIDPTTALEDFPKLPEASPLVYLDGHTLLFINTCPGYIINLVNAQGNIVYYDTIPTGTITWNLPESLTGTYTLYLSANLSIFSATIELE